MPFSPTGRGVHNKIDARFEFRDGKIIRHRDSFDFWAWASQALGPTGRLFGWSGVVKNRVRSQAASNLAAFLRERVVGATVTVTHDRLFLQRVATRILELDRRNAGGLLSVAGDYTTYLRVKGETMHAQERREDVLRNTLRRETEWLRRGAAARSTKQQARIQRAGTPFDRITGRPSAARGSFASSRVIQTSRGWSPVMATARSSARASRYRWTSPSPPGSMVSSSRSPGHDC